jgi:hypothetical protein
MGTVSQVTDALKKFLKARGMTYAALGRRLTASYKALNAQLFVRRRRT